MSPAPVRQLVIIGVGLIGGSVARALKRAGHATHITGVGRSTAHLEKAKSLGVVDDWSTDISSAVSKADMVVVCVPMSAYDGVFAELAGSLPASAIITDAGSTKQQAVDVAHRHLDNTRRFVPAHPIAGTECSGVEASFTELFDGHLCILTPADDTGEEALAAVKALWSATGSRIECMSAAEHDDFLAAVSHLPHMAAYAIVNTVSRLGDEQHDPFRFAAGGFRDFTRIASSSPEMWRDIAMANKAALLHKLEVLQAELNGMHQALETGDAEHLLAEFSAAKKARDTWLAEHEENL